MPADAVVFRIEDPSQYASVLRPAGSRVTKTGTGAFSALFTRVAFGTIWMQGAAETTARVLENTVTRYGISLPLTPETDLWVDGMQVGYGAIAVHGALVRKTQNRTTGPAVWGSVSMCMDDWHGHAPAIAGHPHDLIRLPTVQRPGSGAVSRLRSALLCIMRLAAEAPGRLREPDIARNLENALIQAAADCVVPQTEEPPLAQPLRARVIARFAEFIEDAAEQPLYLPELCAALGVSARMLRQCCQEHYGKGPKQYLLLRRLHLAHAELLAAKPGTGSVTAIATRFGFWELGRFAVYYRQVFGETPVQTLRAARRPPVPLHCLIEAISA